MKGLLWIIIGYCVLGCISCETATHTETGMHNARSEKQVAISNIPAIPAVSSDSALSLLNKANKYWTLRAQDSAAQALQYYKQALSYSEQLNFHEGIARSLGGIGRYWYEIQADYEKAIPHFLRAVVHSKQFKNNNCRIYTIASEYVGKSYLKLSRYDSAVYWLERCLYATQKFRPEDTIFLITTNQYMGIALARSIDNTALNFNRALYYFNAAKDLALSLKRPSPYLADTYGNIGALYHEKEMQDSALYYYNLTVQVYTAVKHPEDKQTVYSNIARIYIQRNDFAAAKQYIDSAIAVDPSNATNELSLQQNLATYYYSSGNWHKAIDLYRQIVKKAEEKKNIHAQLRSYPKLIALLDSTQNIPQAYQYLLNYLVVLQQSYDDKALYAINQTEVKFRTAQKDKELAQKQYQIARQQLKIQQQYLWIGGALTGLILLGAILYRRQQKAKIARLEARLEGEEQERMRLATELHDGIVNRLSYAKMNFDALAPAGTVAHIDAAGFQEAVHYLEQSIAELRATSHNMLPSALENTGLETALNIYCQKITKVLPLAIDFSIEGNLPLLTEAFELHIYRIVQELLNNIIKHAEASAVALVCTADDKHLRISVQDNGKGMPAENLQAGVGLYNLQNRLKILGGKMQVNSSAHGTQILLDFDLKHYILART